MLLEAAARGILASSLALGACGGQAPAVVVPVQPADATPPKPLLVDKSCCAGKNDCKGKSGCQVGGHGCAGRNECMRQGTSCEADPDVIRAQLTEHPEYQHACKGQNYCKGLGGCKTDRHACKGMNDCKGQGGCKY